MMDNRQPPVEPGGDLELTNSETAARRFCLQYDCVRNCYWRPYDLQAEQTRHWESLCSAQENIYRKVDYTHEKICLSRQPNKTRGWISWRINHKGLSVQSVELLLSGIRTFSADAQVKPVLRCGDHSPWPVFVHSTDKHTSGTEGVGRLRVEGIGPADFTELRVSIEGGSTDWGQSQLFSAYNQASGKHGLYLMIRFTDTDEDEIIRADFNVERMANRLMDNFTGNKYRKPDNTVAATGRGHQAAGNADAEVVRAVEGERRPPRRAARAWDSDSDIDLGGDDWRLDDGREWDGYDAAAAFDNGGFGAAALANVGPDGRNFRPNNRNGRGGRAAENNGRVAAAGRGRRRPDRRHIVWGVDGDDDNFVDEEEQEDKRAAFAAEVLRELCSRTRRERMEVARRVQQKLERGKRIVDLFSEALDLFGDRALLLEALFPPHYEDFCLVAINLLHFQLRVQPNRDSICPSVTRNQTELYSAGKFQWNLSPRPYYGINKNSGWSNIGQANMNRGEQWLGQGRPHNLNERTARNDGWNNDAIGLNEYLYGDNANARWEVEEAAASLEVFLEDWGPLPFKFTCRSGNLQPENHMLEILVVREVADGPGGEKQKVLKKFRLRPTQQDGKLILDGSKIQHQADIPSPMKEPFYLHEGVDCLVQIRVLESRRNFIDFKCGGKNDVATTSAAAIVAAGPDNHPLVSGILNVDGIRLYVSKELLHLVSPFFFKLFTQEFAEKGLNEVQLHGLNAAEVEDFLLVVSSRLSAKPVHPNPQNMAALLELAEYFDVPFLTQELGHLFPVFAEIPMHIRLTLAVRYRLTEVKDSLIDSELGEESALLCQRLLLPKLGGQKERELVLDGYLQGKSNKAILKEMLASCM